MSKDTEIQKIEQAIQAQENLRGVLSDEQINATINSLRLTLAQIKNTQQIGKTNLAAEKIDITGDVAGGNVIKDNTIIINPPPASKSLPLPEALQKYLDYLITAHQRLRLQGIRAGSQPLSIDLEKVYVSLTALAVCRREEAV